MAGVAGFELVRFITILKKNIKVSKKFKNKNIFYKYIFIFKFIYILILTFLYITYYNNLELNVQIIYRK